MIKQATLKKLSHNSGREWVGYLTPSEILEVVSAGAKPSASSHYDMACERYRSGAGSPWWFYFTVSEDLRRQLTAR